MLVGGRGGINQIDPDRSSAGTIPKALARDRELNSNISDNAELIRELLVLQARQEQQQQLAAVAAAAANSHSLGGNSIVSSASAGESLVFLFLPTFD